MNAMTYRRFISTLSAWTMCLAMFVCNAEAADVIRMEPFYVDGDGVDLQLRHSHDPVTKVLKSVRIAEVGPRIKKSGIRVGDRVDAINGKEVSRMTTADFDAALPKSDGPDEQKLLFSVSRGVFGKRLEIPIIFRRRGAPNKTPEPTPGAVTDRAGARSAPSPSVAHL